MGIPDQKPQNGMNIAPDGTISELSENFIVSATGAVSSSKVQRTTMGNATVESRVADQIKKIRFPAPQGGGIVIVNYPFVFKNSED